MQHFSSFYHERKSTVRQETATIHTCSTFCYYEREWRSYPRQKLPGAAPTLPARPRWGRNDGTFHASSTTRGPHPEYMIRQRQEGGETRPPLVLTRDLLQKRSGTRPRQGSRLLLALDWGHNGILNFLDWLRSEMCFQAWWCQIRGATRLMLQLTDKLKMHPRHKQAILNMCKAVLQ